jgi:hypothetical protein
MDSSITMKNALYLYNVLANVCKYRRLGESPSLSACQLPMPSAYRPGKYESKRNSKPVIGDFALYVLTRCNPLPFSGIGRGYPSSFQYSSATVHGHSMYLYVLYCTRAIRNALAIFQDHSGCLKQS